MLLMFDTSSRPGWWPLTKSPRETCQKMKSLTTMSRWFVFGPSTQLAFLKEDFSHSITFVFAFQMRGLTNLQLTGLLLASQSMHLQCSVKMKNDQTVTVMKIHLLQKGCHHHQSLTTACRHELVDL